MIELGDRVRDVVSGFTGRAVARMTSLYEAEQIRVHPEVLKADGEMFGSVWIESGRLEVVTGSSRLAGFIKVGEHETQNFGGSAQ